MYIRDRLDQYRNWYDNKAVFTKRRYLQARIWSAIGAVIVPILTNISLPIINITPNYTIDPAKVLITIISTIVALLIALEGVLHYREQWKNYRTTEQYLTAQKNLFCNNVVDYSSLDKEDGFKLLVNRVENAITEENAITLNVLTKIDNGNRSSS
ncbi:DUF4231 domain-containing protein [Chryseobacterium chendengshani]|uniref:DUF4231 domain-containing protein n=1 Tax=Chryseobacterium sp. LJ756 TaxID=2864113 RepID=UPI001C63BDBA|nr:DUF4231 domain-containing protein [Chryseobacterium sp. LJ756]MBW7676171.1 DUF4231 domain-containing protein [Chryseobacterium sp. LJ756]